MFVRAARVAHSAQHQCAAQQARACTISVFTDAASELLLKRAREPSTEALLRSGLGAPGGSLPLRGGHRSRTGASVY